MRRLELSNFRPSEDTGIAVSQSDEFGADMALSLATSHLGLHSEDGQILFDLMGCPRLIDF